MTTPHDLDPARRAAWDAYLTSGCHQIFGYTDRGALEILGWIDDHQRRQGVEGHLLEIGVYFGRYFAGLALRPRAQEVALAVDLFDPSYSEGFDQAVFEGNVRQAVGPARYQQVKVLAQDSMTLAPEDLTGAAGGAFRLTSVDGWHSAAATENDVRLAAATLAEGGAMILDDYFVHKHPGVSEGTCAYFLGEGRGGPVGPVMISGNKLVFAHESIHESLLRHLTERARAADLDCRDEEMFGRPVLVALQRGRLHRLRRGLSQTWLGRWLEGTPLSLR